MGRRPSRTDPAAGRARASGSAPPPLVVRRAAVRLVVALPLLFLFLFLFVGLLLGPLGPRPCRNEQRRRQREERQGGQRLHGRPGLHFSRRLPAPGTPDFSWARASSGGSGRSFSPRPWGPLGRNAALVMVPGPTAQAGWLVPIAQCGTSPNPNTTKSTRSQDGTATESVFRAGRWPLPAGRGRGRLPGRHVQHALANADNGRLRPGRSPPRRPRPTRSSRSGRVPRSTGRPSCRPSSRRPGRRPRRRFRPCRWYRPSRRGLASGNGRPADSSCRTVHVRHVLDLAGDRRGIGALLLRLGRAPALTGLMRLLACRARVRRACQSLVANRFAQVLRSCSRCCCCRSPAWCRPGAPARRPHRQSTP